MPDVKDLSQIVGKTFVSDDCKIKVIAVTADSVCYRIGAIVKTFYNKHKTFELWLRGATEVKDGW